MPKEGRHGGALHELLRAGCAPGHGGRLCAARREGPAPREHGAHLWRDDGRALAPGRLADRAGGDPRGDGEHRGLVEAGVQYPRGDLRGDPREPAALQGRSGAQDRRPRLRVARPAPRAWAAAREFHPAATHPGAPRSHPVPQGADPATGHRGESGPKLLESANIKLGVVATDVLGASGRAMLRALQSGERDGAVLAELAKGTLRQKRAALADALTGRFTGHHAALLGDLMEHIEFLEATIARVSQRIATAVMPMAE